MPPTRTPKKNRSAASHNRPGTYNPVQVEPSEADTKIKREPPPSPGPSTYWHRNIKRESSPSPVPSTHSERYDARFKRSLSPSAPPLPENQVREVIRGNKIVVFQLNSDWKNRTSLIGPATRNIYFGKLFLLTDSHFLDIFNLGFHITRHLRRIRFKSINVNYDTPEIEGSTPSTRTAVLCLERACPTICEVQVAGTNYLGDVSLSVFFSFCSHLTYLETRIPSPLQHTDTRLESLLAEPDSLWLMYHMKRLKHNGEMSRFPRVRHNDEYLHLPWWRKTLSEPDKLIAEFVKMSEERKRENWKMNLGALRLRGWQTKQGEMKEAYEEQARRREQSLKDKAIADYRATGVLTEACLIYDFPSDLEDELEEKLERLRERL